MRIFPQSYNGFLFQQAGRVASEMDDFDWDIGGIQTINTQRANKRPKYSGVIYNGDVKVVHVVLNKPDVDRDALVIAMDVGSEIQRALYSLDELGRQWYVMAKCVGLNVEENDGMTVKYGFIFEVDDPTWTMVQESVDVWDVVADEELHTITVLGNQPTFPIFEFTPGPPVGYYPYTVFVKNYNPIAFSQTDGIDITNGGWNTAALVAAGKMLASGADVRVFMDGAEIPFWVGGGGWDDAATLIFIRATWLPGQSMPLRTALAGSGTPALIEWKITPDIKKALAKLPRKGIIRVGTEEISYKNLNANRCQAEVVERNIRGTSIGAHAVDDVCWWVEHDIRIIYGNAAAEAPVYDETYKPVFDLATSTLTSRVYTEFADTAGLRAGAFIRQVLNDGLGKENRVYSGNAGAIPDVDPATDMGMEIAAYQVQGKTKPETAELAWMFYHPAIITTVTTTADKYKAFATTSWPKVAGLESSKNGTKWVPEWNETAPATAGSPVSISHTSAETMTAGSRYMRFRLAGSINALVDNVTRLEIHGVTLVLTAANVIQVGLSSEQANYQFAVEIRNNRTGNSLYIDYPVAEDETLVVDSEAMEATYKGMNALRGISWNDIRTDWLPLLPGDNELQFFADPTSSVHIVTKTHNRAL